MAKQEVPKKKFKDAIKAYKDQLRTAGADKAEIKKAIKDFNDLLRRAWKRGAVVEE